jgi:hypothetical protein
LTITPFQAYGQRFLRVLKKRVFQQPARLSRDRELSEIYKLAVKNDVPASNTGHEKLNIE